MKNKLHALTLNYTYGFFYIYYKENKLSILKDVDLINSFSNIHQDLIKISYLAYLSDLTNQVYKESNEKDLYNLFISSLLKIEQGFDPMIITNILEVKYLNYLGVGLGLDGCIKCGRTNKIVTIGEGGLICQDCYQNEEIVEALMIKLLRMYLYVDIDSIKSLNIKETIKLKIDNFLTNYYHSYTGLYLKSKNFLEKLKLDLE